VSVYRELMVMLKKRNADKLDWSVALDMVKRLDPADNLGGNILARVILANHCNCKRHFERGIGFHTHVEVCGEVIKALECKTLPPKISYWFFLNLVDATKCYVCVGHMMTFLFE